jgi:hypothetical protein
MLQLLYTYVARVLFICCICCSGYTHMSQSYVLNISDVCCNKCFMLEVFSLVVCFMSFTCIFHLNVACVSSGCCKSRFGIVNVDLVPTCMHVSEARGATACGGTSVGGLHLHARARNTERSETRSSRHKLVCVRATPCGRGRLGAHLQPHAGHARPAATGAACS